MKMVLSIHVSMNFYSSSLDNSCHWTPIVLILVWVTCKTSKALVRGWESLFAYLQHKAHFTGLWSSTWAHSLCFGGPSIPFSSRRMVLQNKIQAIYYLYTPCTKNTHSGWRRCSSLFFGFACRLMAIWLALLWEELTCSAFCPYDMF